jgi:outer membrane protein insertion porin family
MKRFTFSVHGFAFATATLCLVLTSLAAAQSRSAIAKTNSAAGHKLLSVKTSGTARYTDKEILAASGLELGQNAAEGDFQEAAQRLVNSGLFTEVRYSFSYSDASVKVEFQLSDIEQSKLVPAHFDNFVWFTESELRAALAERVPLFKDALPASGQLASRVTRVLQALLEEQHLPGRVDYLHEGQPDEAKPPAIVFRVEDLAMRIRKVEFPGASAEQSAFLAAGTRKLAGADYSRSLLAAAAQNDLLPIFLQHGYLKAQLGPADARVVARTGAQDEDTPKDEIEVDAIVPVTPGKQYSVSEVSWKGNSAVTILEAAPFFHLPEGQPADAVRLLRDVEALIKLYRSRGYMKIQIKPDAQMDDERSTVHYVINVAEGDLYKMGELEFLGVDSASKDRLREAWTLREGQPYNADYTRKFLDDAPRLLPKGLQYSIKLNEELDAKNKTVDVTIQFKAQ